MILEKAPPIIITAAMMKRMLGNVFILQDTFFLGFMPNKNRITLKGRINAR